jgi:hypothetical protein
MPQLDLLLPLAVLLRQSLAPLVSIKLQLVRALVYLLRLGALLAPQVKPQLCCVQLVVSRIELARELALMPNLAFSLPLRAVPARSSVYLEQHLRLVLQVAS